MSTPALSFRLQSARPDSTTTTEQPNPASDPKRVSGRELAERLRAKRRATDEWETEHVRTVRLRPPSQQQPVRGSGQAKQAATTATEQAQAAPFNFDPYGWAVIFWVTGLVVWFRHPQFVTHWLVFAAIVFLIAPAKYLIRTALLIGVGWLLLHKYQIL